MNKQFTVGEKVQCVVLLVIWCTGYQKTEYYWFLVVYRIEDYVAIMGDFEWFGMTVKRFVLEKVAAGKNFTLFIDGNHENFALLKRYEVVDSTTARYIS